MHVTGAPILFVEYSLGFRYFHWKKKGKGEGEGKGKMIDGLSRALKRKGNYFLEAKEQKTA